MSHSFLSIDMTLIPQETKNYIPTFWLGMFSNDGEKNSNGDWVKEPSRMMLDGYNENRGIVHSESVLVAWLQWEADPEKTYQEIIGGAVEYTTEEIRASQKDFNSIWYVNPSKDM